MKRIWKLAVIICVLTACMASTAFAAGWTAGQGANSNRWWYDLGNGQHYGTPASTVEWQWLDGNGDGIAECYAFDEEGWMYGETTTPDGYTVNADGAWTVNSIVQTRTVTVGYSGTRSQVQQPDRAERKVLTAYFSKTGTTREAAQKIQSIVGVRLSEHSGSGKERTGSERQTSIIFPCGKYG